MEQFHLSSGDIITATEKSFAFLSDNQIDRKDALRVKLAAEDVLLTYRQKFGEEAAFSLYLEKRMGIPRVILRIVGESFDPFGGLDEDDRVMHNLMERMGTAPVWNYRRSCNEVVFSAGKKKSLSSAAKILIAVVLGIGLGMLGRLFPGTIAHDIGETWLGPVQNAVMGFLGTLSSLFILFSVTSGISTMGDVSTFNRVGRTLISRLLLVLMIDSVAASVALPFFFQLSGSAAGKADFSTLWQMIINIVPTNIVETFATGNTMQVVFLAIFASIILLIMGPNAQQLVEIITELSNLFQHLIQYVIELMPLVVFVSLFRLSADGDFSSLLSAYKYPLIFFLFCVIELASHVMIFSLRHRIAPRLLIKKLIPTLLITLSTASSTAALPEIRNTCENRFGIDRQIVNVGIPLGQTVDKGTVFISMMIGVLCTAQIFGVEISLSSYLILAVTSLILSVATPPLPGAALAGFTLVITQMGIPSDAMVIIIALDAIIDRLSTGTYVACLQLELANIAKLLNLLDDQTLRADE